MKKSASSEKCFSNPRAERARQRAQYAGAPVPRPLEVNATYGVDKTLVCVFHQPAKGPMPTPGSHGAALATLCGRDKAPVRGRALSVGPLALRDLFEHREHWGTSDGSDAMSMRSKLHRERHRDQVFREPATRYSIASISRSILRIR
jgi:hypothetical protein